MKTEPPIDGFIGDCTVTVNMVPLPRQGMMKTWPMVSCGELVDLCPSTQATVFIKMATTNPEKLTLNPFFMKMLQSLWIVD